MTSIHFLPSFPQKSSRNTSPLDLCFSMTAHSESLAADPRQKMANDKKYNTKFIPCS